MFAFQTEKCLIPLSSYIITRRQKLFDTIKHLFGSIYGCFFVGAFVLGGFYFCFSGQWLLFVGWCLLFVVPWIYILDRRMRKSRELAMKGGEIQIDTERQAKAISDYLSIPSVKKRMENAKVMNRKKRKPRAN
jgi:amino acid permease